MPIVRDNEAELQFELVDDSTVIGVIRYRRSTNSVALVHTEIAPAFEGRGFASVLIEGALRDLRKRGLRVIPICPTVREWIGRHPEFADLETVDDATPD